MRHKLIKLLADKEKTNEKLLDDQKRMLADKAEVYKALTTGSVVSQAVTLTGSIDGHNVEVRGVIQRKGVGSSNPPGACYICARMVSLGTTEQMVQFGVRC